MNAIVDYVKAVEPIPLLQASTLTADVSGTPVGATNEVSIALPPTRAPARDRRLHHLGEVRRRERITLRSVARLLGISINEVKYQEQPSSDMLLSDLYRWQKVLGVPIAELLNEPDDELSPSVQLRAQLLRIMKTVRSIQERARQVSVQRLTEMLVDQLVKVMPELKDTLAWPTVGQRRTKDDFGQAYLRMISHHFLDKSDRLEGSTFDSWDEACGSGDSTGGSESDDRSQL